MRAQTMETATPQPKRRYKVRPTKLQRETALNVVEKGLPPSQAILEAGGSEATAHNPQKVTGSRGYEIALEELGLTRELVTTALVSDINEKPKNRVQELTLASKILGMVKTEAPPPPVTNTYNLFYQPQFQAKLKTFEADVKDIIAHGDNQTIEAPVATE
jgi:hypothetical protein